MRRSNLKVAVQANSKLSLMMDMSTQQQQQQQPSNQPLNDPQNKRLSGGGENTAENNNLIRWNSALAAALTKSTKTESIHISNIETSSRPHFDIVSIMGGKISDERVCIKSLPMFCVRCVIKRALR